MVSFITTLLISIIFAIILSILFNALNLSMLKLFVPIQKFTSSLKRKKLYKNSSMLFFIIIASSIKSFYNLSDIKYGLLLGFFFALHEVIFDTVVNNKNDML